MVIWLKGVHQCRSKILLKALRIAGGILQLDRS
jgi:hypothetical protein